MMMFHAVGPPELVEAGGTFAQGMFRRTGPVAGRLPGRVQVDGTAGRRGRTRRSTPWADWQRPAVAEVQFQHFMFDRDDVPEFLARDVAPQVAGIAAGSHT